MFFLLALVIVLMKKMKKQRKELEMTNEEIDEFMLGIAAEKANARGINGLFILPYDTKLEIPKSDVTISKPRNITVETRYNEHANNKFDRYNEHTFGSSHVKIMLCEMCIPN